MPGKEHAKASWDMKDFYLTNMPVFVHRSFLLFPNALFPSTAGAALSFSHLAPPQVLPLDLFSLIVKANIKSLCCTTK